MGIWFKTYRQHRIDGLLEIRHGGSLNAAVVEALNQKLKQPEGFASYEAVQEWLREHYGID